MYIKSVAKAFTFKILLICNKTYLKTFNITVSLQISIEKSLCNHVKEKTRGQRMYSL